MNTEIQQRPRCMFPARAAAEIAAGHDDVTLIHVLGHSRPYLLERERSEAIVVVAGEPLRRDYLVGIHVIAEQPDLASNFLHVDHSSLISCGSDIFPVIALAATTAGPAR